MRNNKITVKFVDKEIDALFREFDQCALPGVAIDGSPVYRKGFGLASVELPIVLSSAIRMRIGSTTKHFTCLAYMLLCEAGEAGIDDPIGKYLPELNPVAREVTMRQLMGNISGLRDVFDMTWQFSGTPWMSSAELLSMYHDIDDVNAPPGTNWIYNNGGFLMLSVAIERITNQPFGDFLRRRIFEPIGMYDTLLRDSEKGFLANSATLHMQHSVGGEYQRSPYFGLEFAGAGGIVSTVDDLLRWLSHMNAPTIGTPTTWKTMKTPLRLANGTTSGYGLGLISERYRGIDIIHHPGGGMGGNAQIVKVPDVGLDVVVIVNREESGWELANNILDTCLVGLDAKKSPFSGPFAAGTFRSPGTGRVVQLSVQNGRQFVSVDGKDGHFEPDEAGALLPVRSPTKQSVRLVGDPGKPTSIRFTDCGNADELVREEPAKNSDVQAIAGYYRCGAIGAEAKIIKTDDGPRLITSGSNGSRVYWVECLADGVWQAKRTWISPQSGGILLFDHDSDGFRFSSYRTWALPFRRDGNPPARLK